MYKILVLLTVVGCCLAASKRQVSSHLAQGSVQDVPVTDDQGPVHEAQVVPQGRGVQFHDEPVPTYPQFGVKVDQPAEPRKAVRSRARAILGQGYNRRYNHVPAQYVQEVRFQNSAAPKVLVAPYQQKPLYQATRGDQQAYQHYTNYYGQRTDDVPQTYPGTIPGPIHPAGIAPSPVTADKVDPPKPVAILSMNQDVNYDGTFVYDFESENGIRSAASGSTKFVEGFEEPVQVMSGSYSYTSPEGEPVETRWFADETGFHAEGSHLPVAPPVPEAIQRAVDYLKTLPPKEDEVEGAAPANYHPQQNYDNYPSYQQQQSFDKYPSYQQQPYPANF